MADQFQIVISGSVTRVAFTRKSSSCGHRMLALHYVPWVPTELFCRLCASFTNCRISIAYIVYYNGITTLAMHCIAGLYYWDHMIYDDCVVVGSHDAIREVDISSKSTMEGTRLSRQRSCY